jgi:23S rRNA (uracil1939-C5)-methyltransferase
MRGTRTPRASSRQAAAVQISITELAPGGKGVGHTVVSGERRAVFIPGAAVGDELDATVDLSSRPARGTILRVLVPGPGRVVPPCPYVDRCGACDWMHLGPDAQKDARTRQLYAALPEGFRQATPVIHDALDTLAYRTRARVHVRASGGRAVVGLFAAGTRDVVEVESCAILHPTLDAALTTLGPLLDGAHGHGEARLALGAAGKAVVTLTWEGKMPGAAFGHFEEAVAKGTLGGASLTLGDVTRPAVIGDPTPQMIGADGAPLVLPAGGFAQASERSNVVLGQRVAELAREAAGNASRSANVVELYAGAGNFTVLLARDFESVTAVESSEPACEAARKNLSARGLRARVTAADVDTFALPAKTALVVLDPPRTGARAACLALARSRVKAIVYVSCDTSTLARDLTILAPRFSAFAIDGFALFPQTSHAETVVAMQRVAP